MVYIALALVLFMSVCIAMLVGKFITWIKGKETKNLFFWIAAFFCSVWIFSFWVMPQVALDMAEQLSRFFR